MRPQSFFADQPWLNIGPCQLQTRLQLLRSLLQVVTGTFPYGQQLVKYGYKENAECTLCKKAHEEIFKMWDALEKRRLGTLWDQEQ